MCELVVLFVFVGCDASFERRGSAPALVRFNLLKEAGNKGAESGACTQPIVFKLTLLTHTCIN